MLSCFRVRSIFSSRRVVSLTSSFSVKERERDDVIIPPFPLAPPPSSPFPHSPSLSLNFLMATSSLVSCKDTRMRHKTCRARGERRKRKVSQNPLGIWKKENGVLKLQEEKCNTLVFIYAMYSHAKGLQHPWHSSCANLQLSVHRLISLKKMRLLQRNRYISDIGCQ